jgi:hypothetical protein
MPARTTTTSCKMLTRYAQRDAAPRRVEAGTNVRCRRSVRGRSAPLIARHGKGEGQGVHHVRADFEPVVVEVEVLELHHRRELVWGVVGGGGGPRPRRRGSPARAAGGHTGVVLLLRLTRRGG